MRIEEPETQNVHILRLGSGVERMSCGIGMSVRVILLRMRMRLRA